MHLRARPVRRRKNLAAEIGTSFANLVGPALRRGGSRKACSCPLWVRSGYPEDKYRCPFYPESGRRLKESKSIRSIYSDHGTQWQEVAIPAQHGRIKAGRATTVQKQGVLASKLIPEETRELTERNF